MSRDDIPTLVPCLACGGAFRFLEELASGRYRTVLCAWCTRGGMTAAQLKVWKERRLK
jgi:hypothetical protein